MITNKSYKDLKEYWDFQRKKEYNREMVFGMADQFEGRVYNDFGMVNLQDMKELLWHRVKAEDYEEPRKGWVPEDPNIGLSGKAQLICLNLKHMKMICLKEVGLLY